jgi:hypothetical protein
LIVNYIIKEKVIGVIIEYFSRYKIVLINYHQNSFPIILKSIIIIQSINHSILAVIISLLPQLFCFIILVLSFLLFVLLLLLSSSADEEPSFQFLLYFIFLYRIICISQDYYFLFFSNFPEYLTTKTIK